MTATKALLLLLYGFLGQPKTVYAASVKSALQWRGLTLDTTINISDILNIFLVAILVLITAFYAWRTHAMVGEMRLTRSAQVLPRLKVGISAITPTASDVNIVNVGPGPALNITLKLSFVGRETEERNWTCPLMESGESARFFFPGGAVQNDALVDTWQTISMQASYLDAFDNRHEIEDSVDFAGYWNQVKVAGQLYDVLPIERISQEMKKQTKELEKIAGRLQQLSGGKKLF